MNENNNPPPGCVFDPPCNDCAEYGSKMKAKQSVQKRSKCTSCGHNAHETICVEGVAADYPPGHDFCQCIEI